MVLEFTSLRHKILGCSCSISQGWLITQPYDITFTCKETLLNIFGRNLSRKSEFGVRNLRRILIWFQFIVSSISSARREFSCTFVWSKVSSVPPFKPMFFCDDWTIKNVKWYWWYVANCIARSLLLVRVWVLRFHLLLEWKHGNPEGSLPFASFVCPHDEWMLCWLPRWQQAVREQQNADHSAL